MLDLLADKVRANEDDWVDLIVGMGAGWRETIVRRT